LFYWDERKRTCPEKRGARIQCGASRFTAAALIARQLGIGEGTVFGILAVAKE
jgi:hypothetical protein